MIVAKISARALLKVHHERPYDYDEARGLWVYKQVDDDEEVANLVTDAGRRTLHTYIYGTAAQRITANLASGMNYIGLSNNGSAPSASDTVLTDELTTDGLGRILGTVTLPVAAGTITQIQNTFTYSGLVAQEVQKTALFDAVSAGNMAHEILFTQRSLATDDTLTLTFSITLT